MVKERKGSSSGPPFEPTEWLDSDWYKRCHGFDELPKVPPDAFKVLADHSGYVARYKLQNVIRQAEKLDLSIRYHPNIGEFVAEGTILAYVWNSRPAEKRKSLKTRILLDGSSKRGMQVRTSLGHDDDDDDKRSKALLAEEKEAEELLGVLVASGVEISTFRSGQLDVLLGVQQLTDVAVKALSAAVNDPMTAIQALDCLAVLFGWLAHLAFAISCACDSKDNNLLRVSAPRRSFAYLLSMADAIRFYGGADL